MKLYHLIIQIFILLFSLEVFASAPLISGSDHIQAKDGLSSDRVFSIVEDKDGVIWMGTKGGVDRFNGREFKHYSLDDDFYYGDFAARVVKLLINSRNELMAYDNTGRLYGFNPVLDKFEVKLRLKDRFKKYITLNTVVPDSDGSLLMGLTSGLFRLEDDSISEVAPDLNVNDIMVIDDGLLLATTAGCILMPSDSGERKTLSDKNTQTLFYDDNTRYVYIGTFNNGLWRYNLGSFTGITDPEKITAIKEGEQVHMFVDWIKVSNLK